MSQPQDSVLLIYNHWEWKATDPLSLSIRMVTYGPNHTARRRGDKVHEMVGSSLWWVIKKALRFKVSYEPNEGSGYRVTPYDEWLKSATREVIEMEPVVPMDEPTGGEGYGYLDLIQIFLHIVRTKWLLVGNKWNGKDGCRLWPGTTCAEYVAKALGRLDAHILTPADLQHIPELRKIGEFSTEKGVGRPADFEFMPGMIKGEEFETVKREFFG